MERRKPLYRADLIWLFKEINEVSLALLKYGSDPLKDNSRLNDSQMLRISLLNLQKAIEELLSE